jgi:hypothetical protein
MPKRPPKDAPMSSARHDDATAGADHSLIGQSGRAASRLAWREAQLAAARRRPELRRAALLIAIGLGVALALFTGFVLANVAAVTALADPLPGWAAPLVLAAAWLAVASLFVFGLSRGRRQPRTDRAEGPHTIHAREQARDSAQQDVQESLDQLRGELSNEAGVLATAAAAPVAGGVITAGEHIIDRIDELADQLGKAVPAGGVISRMAHMALAPGRYLVKEARTALPDRAAPERRGGTNARPLATQDPSSTYPTDGTDR